MLSHLAHPTNQLFNKLHFEFELARFRNSTCEENRCARIGCSARPDRWTNRSFDLPAWKNTSFQRDNKAPGLRVRATAASSKNSKGLKAFVYEAKLNR